MCFPSSRSVYNFEYDLCFVSKSFTLLPNHAWIRMKQNKLLTMQTQAAIWTIVLAIRSRRNFAPCSFVITATVEFCIFELNCTYISNSLWFETNNLPLKAKRVWIFWVLHAPITTLSAVSVKCWKKDTVGINIFNLCFQSAKWAMDLCTRCTLHVHVYTGQPCKACCHLAVFAVMLCEAQYI